MRNLLAKWAVKFRAFNCIPCLHFVAKAEKLAWERGHMNTPCRETVCNYVTCEFKPLTSTPALHKKQNVYDKSKMSTNG